MRAARRCFAYSLLTLRASISNTSVNMSNTDMPVVHDAPALIYGHHDGLYGCRIIPELGGDIVGFEMTQGGFRDVRLADRDFSDLSMSEWFASLGRDTGRG